MALRSRERRPSRSTRDSKTIFEPSRVPGGRLAQRASLRVVHLALFCRAGEGRARPIFEAWVAAEDGDHSRGHHRRRRTAAPFRTHFRDFAVRNWNVDLPGHPIPLLYKDLKATDGTSPPFPKANPPFVTVVKLPATVGDPKMHLRTIRSPRSTTRSPSSRMSRRSSSSSTSCPRRRRGPARGNRRPDTWSRQNDKSQPLVYCRDHEAENVYRIIVVSSNHEKTRDVLEQGDYGVGQPSCCGELADVTAWKGHVTLHYSFSGQTTVPYTVTRDQPDLRYFRRHGGGL